MGKYGETFAPVVPDKLLRDRSTIKLGGTDPSQPSRPYERFLQLSGKCKGRDKTYKVLIANLPSIIIYGKFSGVKSYPSIQNDYASTISSMKALNFDLWVASHASQFNLHKLRKESDPYDPTIFGDKKAYLEVLNYLEKAYSNVLKKEDTP